MIARVVLVAPVPALRRLVIPDGADDATVDAAVAAARRIFPAGARGDLSYNPAHQDLTHRWAAEGNAYYLIAFDGGFVAHVDGGFRFLSALEQLAEAGIEDA